MSAQLKAWTGEFGNDYVKRNEVDPHTLERLECFWHRLCGCCVVTSALEVGANIGINLRAMPDAVECFALEPNELARRRMLNDGVIDREHIVLGSAEEIQAPDNSFDFVFTSGVLIHVAPENLLQACTEIHRVSKRLIGCVEYFSSDPVTISYRGHERLLFKRDFGQFWMDNFDLKCLDYGFLWKGAGEPDNVNWWLFEKAA